MFHIVVGVVLVSGIALTHGLSEEQTLLFKTTGIREHNTNRIGRVNVSERGRYWIITSNNIPDHDTGDFPTKSNPNEIQVQSYRFEVPKNPEVNDVSTCLPMGPIAIATNGIVMYNPWDADGENAVEGEGAEVFDLCDGHPDIKGRYHYHRQPSSCLFTITEDPSPLVGVAFDGFAIYGPVDENGRLLTSDDLDECHGRKNSISGDYQYHTTADFPYILGCYRGTPTIGTNRSNCRKASDADAEGNVLNPV
ncbi:uncharacterized protein LOC121409383 [Lytechinus variegatus]|uniref:uncharacterized protein LOC121409383 n=1 Tax=Lytechinus variegatus TaxID=7654 RepID=UPI001BB1A4E9|nr:uncharacterized protein LOC121409383 [Lytechinus variegatus]